MDTFYIDGTIENISLELNTIKNNNDKLAHLHSERKRFLSKNIATSKEAGIILQWIDAERERLKDAILMEKGDQPIPSHRTTKQKTSYHWQDTPEKLTALYHKMTDSGLIDKHTPESVFKALFDGKPLEGISPVKWQKRTVLLAYFIHKLSTANNKISSSDDHWQIAQKVFTVNGEHPTSLRQSWDRCVNNKEARPKQDHELVDDLF